MKKDCAKTLSYEYVSKLVQNERCKVLDFFGNLVHLRDKQCYVIEYAESEKIYTIIQLSGIFAKTFYGYLSLKEVK